MKLKTREFQFDYQWGKITSKDDGLDDFYIRCLGSRQREDISERWIMFWRGRTISFAETIRLSDWEKPEFTSDGRRIVIINKMGMSDRFNYLSELFVVSRFEGFSSREEQSEFISLFLRAMSACKHNVIPHKGKKCVAVIGDELQVSLDRGVYLS